MSLSKADRAFFDWLDEAPCTPNGVLITTVAGDTRNVSREVVAREFRSRVKARPRLERAQNLLAIFSHQLEREERQ